MFFREITKKIDFEDKKEPIILFMIFFLPGFISQTKLMDGSVFDSLWFNLMYLITVIPQMMLILYLIGKKESSKKTLYGLDKITKKDLRNSLIYFIGIFAIVIITGIFSYLITSLISGSLQSIPEKLPLWKFDNKILTPLILFTCMATGYSEELFFRSYLLTEFNIQGKEIYTIIGVSFIFGLGHIYQGLNGFLGTFVIGIFLSVIFVKNRRLHSIAIAHGLYNFTVLMISGSLS